MEPPAPVTRMRRPVMQSAMAPASSRMGRRPRKSSRWRRCRSVPWTGPSIRFTGGRTSSSRSSAFTRRWIWRRRSGESEGMATTTDSAPVCSTTSSSRSRPPMTRVPPSRRRRLERSSSRIATGESRRSSPDSRDSALSSCRPPSPAPRTTTLRASGRPRLLGVRAERTAKRVANMARRAPAGTVNGRLRATGSQGVARTTVASTPDTIRQ